MTSQMRAAAAAIIASKGVKPGQTIHVYHHLSQRDRDWNTFERRCNLVMGSLLAVAVGAFIYPKYMEKRTMSLYNSEERTIELYKWILQQSEKESPRTEEERRAKLERELLVKALLEEEENKATTS